MKLLMKVMAPFRRPKRHGCNKYRQKAVSIGDFGQSIAQAGYANCDESISRSRHSCRVRQMEGEIPQHLARQPADDECGAQFPNDADEEPVMKPRLCRSLIHGDSYGEVYKWKA